MKVGLLDCTRSWVLYMAGVLVDCSETDLWFSGVLTPVTS